MEKAFANMEELASTIREYADAKIDSAKLSVAEKSSGILANVIAASIVVLVFLFFLGLASMGLAFGLGDWIGKTWAGFLVVAGFYLVIGIIVWAGRGRLIRLPLMNKMIEQLFRKDEED